MQYEIEIGGRIRRATVHRADGKFMVEIDGNRCSVDAQRVDGQSMSLLIDGTVGQKPGSRPTTTSHEVTVVPDRGSGQLAVNVGTKSVMVAMNGRRRAERRTDGLHAGSGLQRVLAPMPGKIVRILVKQGDTVQPRQPIVVIEAMKMENELRAVRDGVIEVIHVREGQSVDASELLAVIAAHAT